MKRYLKKLKKIALPKKTKILTQKEMRHKLVGPPNLWKMKQDFQILFLNSRGLKREDRLLDIGCGTLRGGIPIIRKLDRGNYCGIDVRENVLAEARKELKQECLEEKMPDLISFNDFASLEIDGDFDIVFAFSVLIHLEDSIAQECFHFVNKHISNSGFFYANVNIESNEEGNWQGFPVVFRTRKFYKKIAANANLEMIEIGRLMDLGHNSNQPLADKQIMLAFRKNK
ncbi:class I SAM-dependent methyltransferase [Aequorivita marina]|uniref:class I SAM-dependent methyltransferase n=1 Tax=Aequorivita marina TaxID=3073654 RepID=UPI0028758F50|nr:class I SAM-dependent methyltransferase [Aequorivita sp. S2608]MDS1298059.1 class I SAM-dependent methyltransferase [Aequorivita sp. S2608]